MPRPFFDEATGWWVTPLVGEPGSIRWLFGPERGRDNPPTLEEQLAPAFGPEHPADEPPPDEPPPGYETGPFYPDEELVATWQAYAGDYFRGESEPMDPADFTRDPYTSEGGCSVPAHHPPQGTLIGLPGQGTHSRTSPPNNWQSDEAVDVWLFPGTPLRAVAHGVVSSHFGYGLSDPNPASRFGGYRLHVEHTSGMVTFYQHMRRIRVRRGALVKRGDVLGWSGFGACVPHLHFACRPPFDPVYWSRSTWKVGEEPPPPPGDGNGDHGPPPEHARTPAQAWHHLVHVVGPARTAERKRVHAARRAIRDALT